MTGIKRNFAYNLFYQILVIVLPLVTTPYLARVLGAEKTGIYSYAYSVANYFVLFAMLGLNNYGNREVARNRDDIDSRSKTFWSIYFLQVSTSLLTLLCYIGYCLLFGRNNIICWILVMYVLSAGFDINWFFWGMEEFRITVIRNTVIKLGSILAILLLVKSKDDLAIYTVIMSLSNLLSPVLLWPYLKKRIKWFLPSRKQICEHIKSNLVLFVPVIAVSLYKIMDKIMLGALATYTEVGYYEYSEKIIAIPIACVNALGVVMLPRMSNLVANNKNEEEHSLIMKSLIVGVSLAASMGLGLMGIADQFVPFFYGAGYEKCVTLFYILLPSCIFLAVANVLRTQFLIPRKKDREYIISVFLGSIVNLLVNALLIPVFQSVGAAIGTLAAEATVCFYQMIAIQKEFPIKKYLMDVIWLSVFGCVMFAFVFMIPVIGSPILTMGIKIVIGVVIYGCLFFAKYKHFFRALL